jgi:LEA14-like dessication related protein
VTFNGVDVAPQGPGQTRLSVRLAIDNPNSFPLVYGGIDGRLLDDDRSIAAVQRKDGPVIAPSTVTEVRVPVDVPMLSVANLLQSKTASIRLSATVTLGGHPFPIEETAAIH